MHLALTDLFKAHWTEQIHEEWINSLLRTGKYQRDKLERAKALMNMHVRDAIVTDYEAFIETVDLPDPNDRHVLAAAIRCNADAIITINLKHFPPSALNAYGVEPLHPDDFIYYQIDMEPAICCSAFKQQRQALKKPPMDVNTFLGKLQNQQLPQTVAKLKEFEALL